MKNTRRHRGRVGVLHYRKDDLRDRMSYAMNSKVLEHGVMGGYVTKPDAPILTRKTIYNKTKIRS